ncbi:MAG TPA: AsmA-like C-terminal region-containing protein, partial [Thermoanaerobaculia bacterium]|nr:AsmA-like C-terminal region-containing protein [Thermoanaerobaculia bacterium]
AGRITSPSGRIQKLPFEDLVADWAVDKGLLTLSPRARVFHGTLAARVETDLAHPASESRVSLDVRSVAAAPFVESLTSLRNVIAGVLTAKVSLSSRGLGWVALTRTARGEGRVTLENTDLRTVELMPAVTRSLAALANVPGFRVPANLESTRFTTLATNVRLAGGRVATPGLSLSGPQATVTADGSLGFDRSLSYQGRIVLGPALVKSFGRAGRYIADEQGRLALPFRVTGQVTAPKVSIDETIVLALGQRVLARQVGERIPGGLGKVMGDALGESGGKKTEPLDFLQQLLKPSRPTPKPH